MSVEARATSGAPDVSGRRVVVVGATGGIGRAIVAELLSGGAAVIGGGRSPEALEELQSEGAVAFQLDLGERDSVSNFVDQVLAHFDGTLDALVVASGVLGPIGPTRTVDTEELAETFNVNVVATIALIGGFAATLDAAPNPSVVLFSGGGSTAPFANYSAYALSKISTVKLVENLALEEPRWKVNAVAPGFVVTNIHEATLAAGEENVGSDYFKETRKRLASGSAASPAVAADLVRFLVSDQSDGISGRLISAPWDSWQDPEGRDLITRESFGTLRRIDWQFYSPVEKREVT